MVYLFLANGFEECEAITPLDILRRANVEVKTVGIGSNTITGSHNITINCDTVNKNLNLDKLEGIILPGGIPGTPNLEKDNTVQATIDYCNENGLLICAICAAPSILGHKGLLRGKKATCYPGFEPELLGAEIINEKVVSDNNIITACGAGAASDFGFKILGYLKDERTANDIKNAMKF
ncbi:MAG: DJ-1/PfpI family protein [Clostridia bacterium]|nr:DJ-1/PfpI family protein [Clostridia bacterium]